MEELGRLQSRITKRTEMKRSVIPLNEFKRSQLWGRMFPGINRRWKNFAKESTQIQEAQRLREV